MISNIKIADTATYDYEGVNFQNLKEINYIYGTNGTGKTTISRFLEQCNSIDKGEFQNCNINWKNDSSLILVYNKDFREKHFSSDNIPGIFSLGAENTSILEQIDNNKDKIDKLFSEKFKKKRQLSDFQEQLESESKQFSDILWIKLYKKNKDIFGNSFVGFGKKDLFKQKILDTYLTKTKKQTLEFSKLESLSQTLYSNELTILKTIQEIDYSAIAKIENNSIWSKKIIGKKDVPIGKLIEELNNTDWVSSGLQYANGEICPFCQQKTLGENFYKQINDFFDKQYEENKKTLQDLYETYTKLTTKLITDINNIYLEQSQLQHSKLNLEIFESIRNSIISLFSENIQKMKIKIKESSVSVTINNKEDYFLRVNNIIGFANKEIRNHNNIVENAEEEKELLKEDIFLFLSDQLETTISDYLQKIENINKAITGIEGKILNITNEIVSKEKEISNYTDKIVSIKPGIERINKILDQFEMTNFKIVESKQKENYYEIQRENGELVKQTLSEGEITFLTFLYYIQVVEGGLEKDQTKANKIIVIDDPISSLDSYILYVVSSIINEYINDLLNRESDRKNKYIKQIILLTHNVYFHKEISFFGRNNNSSKVTYWVLKKVKNITKNEYFEENPIRSTYQLLWKDIKSCQGQSAISLQNTMRRILENYFKILGNLDYKDIYTKFEDVQEKRICKSLISWINDGSHTIHDELFVQQQDELNSLYIKIFEDIFKKMEHEKHYKMMMEA